MHLTRLTKLFGRNEFGKVIMRERSQKGYIWGKKTARLHSVKKFGKAAFEGKKTARLHSG